MHRAPLAALTILLALCAGAVHAGDAARGQKLFQNTRGMTGKPVGNCVTCHANQVALREMITNRGGKATDARSIGKILVAALDGAVPGAINAKAQFRGVLTARDIDDLATYIAGSKRAGIDTRASGRRVDGA